MVVLKDGAWLDTAERIVEAVEDGAEPASLIVPAEVFAACQARGEAFPAGLWVDGDSEPETLLPILDRVGLIAVRLPAFTDGRAYSLARLLRDRYRFDGDLRAFGDVLVDQLFYLHRCGFSSFELRGDQDRQRALAALETFRYVYQGASDGRRGLLERS